MMLAFPEFKRQPALLRAAVARLEDELDKQVAPDGSMIEGSPGYQNCCLKLLQEILLLSSEHDLVLPPPVHERIHDLAATAVAWTKPDGRVPMFGDSQDDDLSRVAPTLSQQLGGVPGLEWVLSNRDGGQPPPFRSVAFPCIGYYVMRSGWDRKALCLAFDGGRFGQAHHHEDMLSFELQAYGRELIVDPGVYGYAKHWFRDWSILTQAHNAVTVDGAGQCRWRQDRREWFSHQPLDNPWRVGPEWESVEAGFRGPWETDIGAVAVRRRIVFHKPTQRGVAPPPFWWITDWIDGNGDHEVMESFHFSHAVKTLHTNGLCAWTDDAACANLAVLCLDDESPAIRLTAHRGEETPCAGWVSPERGVIEPAWELRFSRKGRLPLRRDFLLIPHPSPWTQAPRASLTRTDNTVILEIREDESIWNVKFPYE